MITVAEIIEMSYTLVDLFANRKKKEPKEIVIDIDPTDAETHGQQQGTLFHGFYMQYQYYPLLVFCEGICIGALLRKGTAGANRYAIYEFTESEVVVVGGNIKTEEVEVERISNNEVFITNINELKADGGIKEIIDTIEKVERG